MSSTTASPPRITIATTSGSSGKTTNAVNYAADLADRGYQVLLCDMDWQMDASRWLGVDEAELEERLTSLDVLRDRSTITDAIIPSTVPGVDLLPASPQLRVAGEVFAGKPGTENQLRRALDLVEERYDVIIIDSRAGVELPTTASLVAAEWIIGATWAGIKELRNTVSLQDHIEDLADRYERPMKLAGIAPGNVPAAGAAYKQALELAAELFGDLLLPPVRHSVSVTEAHAQRLPLNARRRWRPVADDVHTVVSALIDRGVFPAAPAVRAA